MSRPVAVGPQSRTVIGDDGSPSVASVLRGPPPKPKFNWRHYIVPAALVGVAGYIVYKGKI